MDSIAILFLLALERAPLPTVLLSAQYRAVVAGECGEVVEGCLVFTLPEFTCGPAPAGGCINQPCTYIQTCEPRGPRKPKPQPEPMIASGEPTSGRLRDGR